MWGFEDAVIAQTSCEVHTFDCTKVYQRKSSTRNILHYTCLGDPDTTPYLATTLMDNGKGERGKIELLETIMADLGHENVGLFKIDIEGAHISTHSDMQTHTHTHAHAGKHTHTHACTHKHTNRI
jgi:hypothetical protein